MSVAQVCNGGFVLIGMVQVAIVVAMMAVVVWLGCLPVPLGVTHRMRVYSQSRLHQPDGTSINAVHVGQASNRHQTTGITITNR
jgi:hypothetical protein